jgi:hypothetical protein
MSCSVTRRDKNCHGKSLLRALSMMYRTGTTSPSRTHHRWMIKPTPSRRLAKLAKMPSASLRVVVAVAVAVAAMENAVESAESNAAENARLVLNLFEASAPARAQMSPSMMTSNHGKPT